MNEMANPGSACDAVASDVPIMEIGPSRTAPMLHYFYLLQRTWLNTSLRPALSASWRQRRFAPCLPLCGALVATRPIPDDAVVRAVIAGAGYDRSLWHALIGECLVFGADELPRIPCMIDVLTCWLAPHRLGADPAGRAAFTPIEQVYFGTRDLRCAGGWYRPDHVGWNDADDLARLTDYLQSIDIGKWDAEALAPLSHLPNAAERAEELAYVRDWWPALIDMYAQARSAGQVIVCERP